MLDAMEAALNSPLFSFALGLLILEGGMIRIQERKYSVKNLWSVFLLSFGLRCILKGIL